MKTALIQVVFPREGGRGRAQTLSHPALFLYATFIFLSQFGLSYLSLRFPGILGFASNIKAEEIIEQANRQRQANNLAPLRVNEQLTQAAYLKAAYMFEKDFWAHIAPDGKTPWKFILDSGYRYLYAGENLAKDFQESQDVVEAWMNSKAGHRENILSQNYEDVGVAIVNGTLGSFQTTLVVQMFGSSSAPRLAQASGPGPQVPVTTEPGIAAQPEAGRPIEVSQKVESPAPTKAPGVRPEPSSLAFQPTQGQPLIPVVEVIALVKSISFALGFFLLALFVIDGLVVFRRGMVRISGHNGAHILILVMILASTWFLSAGSIK